MHTSSSLAAPAAAIKRSASSSSQAPSQSYSDVPDLDGEELEILNELEKTLVNEEDTDDESPLSPSKLTVALKPEITLVADIAYHSPVKVAYTITPPTPTTRAGASPSTAYSPCSPRQPPASSSKRKHSDLSPGESFMGILCKKPKTLPEPCVVIHDDAVCRLLFMLGISEGVRWEIARLVSAKRVDIASITQARLERLTGPDSVAAPQVYTVLCNPSAADSAFYAAYEQEFSVKTPWQELDREASSSPEERLGILNPATKTHEKSERWYGGKVHFNLRIKMPAKADQILPPFSYEVVRAEKSTSNRARRQYGSAAFVQASAENKFVNGALLDFLQRPLIILGRVYRAFCEKEGHVYFVRTNEVFRGGVILSPSPGANKGWPTFLQFVMDFNPMDENQCQPLIKWAARFVLFLSPSVPVPCPVDETNILHLDDVVAEGHPPSGKIPAERDMTDGNGLMNLPLLQLIADTLNNGIVPALIQDRFGGCKGTHSRHHDLEENQPGVPPRIWNRPSQRKIAYPKAAPVPVHRRIIDVLRCSRMTDGSKISSEVIINLAENRVPWEVFKSLITTNFQALLDDWLCFDRPDFAVHLRSFVMRNSNVLGARQARLLAGEARARGLKWHDKTVEVAEDEEAAEDDDDHAHSSAWWPDPISRLPSSLEETVIEFLDAGFTPANCPVLRKKLLECIKSSLHRCINPPRYSIPVPMSCFGFFMPDPCGVLEDGQVYIRRSKNLEFIDRSQRWESDLILGDVLITRFPCKVLTDVRKFRAVDHSQLINYRDVIIFSVKGTRSAANVLGGGDYDGDTGLVIFDPEIVNPFTNTSLNHADPPEDFDENFEIKIEKVSDFLEKHRHSAEDVRLLAVQRVLLGDDYDLSLIGKYSKYHLQSVYINGYGNEETERLAHMFCHVLDGQKSGKTVKKDVQSEDKDKYGRQKLFWCEPLPRAKGKRTKAPFDTSNLPTAKRPKVLGPFIMDLVRAHMEQELTTARIKADQVLDPDGNSPLDTDLASPWREAEELAQKRESQKGDRRAQDELALVIAHVDAIRQEHKAQIKGDFTLLPIERRQDILRGLSRAFALESFAAKLQAERPDGIGEIIEYPEHFLRWILASCIYVRDYEAHPFKANRLPWDVAFGVLCDIKASKTPGARTVTASLYEKASVSRKYLS